MFGLPIRRESLVVVGRALAAFLLLLGPLIGAEYWSRQQGPWLRTRLSGYATAMDLKQMMVHARRSCPDVVTMGSSLTDRALPPSELDGNRIGKRRTRSSFDFAGAGMRASSMLQAFHWLSSTGCTPKVLLIEAHPVVLNGAKGGAMHDATLMDAATFFAMPRGFTEAREYDSRQLAEVLSYEQLFLLRRRSQIVDQFMADTGWDIRFSPPEGQHELETRARKRKRTERKPKALRKDGKVRGYKRDTLAGSAYEKERRRRLLMFAKGDFEFAWSEFEEQCLLALAQEASRSGVQVVLHTPPATEVYRDILGRLNGLERWHAFHERLGAVEGVEWFDQFAEPYEHALFTDYVHLSRRGASKYTRALLRSLRSKR